MSNNNTNEVEVTHVTENSVEAKDENEEFYNTYNIMFTKKTYDRNVDRKSFPNYYILMFNGNLDEKIYEFNGSGEITPAKYKEFHSLSFGGKTYIVSNQQLSIGNKRTKAKKGGIFG